MNLFHCADAAPETVPAPASVQTPLGRVRLGAVLHGVNVAAEPPTETRRLPSGGWVACWHRPAFDLELLLCRPALLPQPDMHLTDCWAVLWRLRAYVAIGSCTFTALWEEGYSWTRGGPDSGQYLYAKEWNDRQVEVHIGTDDSESLASRSKRSNGLPPEWEPYFRSTPNNLDWFSLQMVHSAVGEQGVPVPLPPLVAGGQCQIHFAVAWSQVGEVGAAAWYAVDLSASQILSAAGCS